MTVLPLTQPHRPALLDTVTAKVASWRESRRIARLEREATVANQGRITVREHLRRLGLTEQQIRSTESQVGKKVAVAYRAATGLEPQKTGLAVVRGKSYQVDAYGWDQLDLISRTVVNYPAIAALIGA